MLIIKLQKEEFYKIFNGDNKSDLYVVKANIKELIKNFKDKIKDVEVKSPYGIIVGNEGNGVSEEVASLVNNKIIIEMNNKCESLNVGVAASIIMYELGGL